MLYNLFFGVVLRDRAYFYYIGYLLALTASVVSYTSIPEEYLFREGSVRIYVQALVGFAVFFAICFVNAFLGIREQRPLAWRVSTGIAFTVLVFGLMVAFSVTIVPADFTGNVMHLGLLLGGLYFLGVSVISYFRGRPEARFLAQSMVVLLVSLSLYLAFTYAWLPYHPLLLHAVEIGALLEGVLLSLALADRVRVINQQRDAAERAAMDAQRFYARKLLLAQESDRERFSGTLHDSIGHGMLVLKQNLEKLATNPALAEAATGPRGLREQIDYCGEILDEVRGMSHDLHPHQLQRLGLETALRTTMERAFDSTDIDWDADIAPVPASLSDERKITLYRVVQECVNNILKHAGASEVILLTEASGAFYTIRVKDDGRGFTPSDINGDGLGLAGMRERMRLFGGRFVIESAPGEGTQVVFAMPLD